MKLTDKEILSGIKKWLVQNKMTQLRTNNMTENKNGKRITAVWRNGGFSASYDSFVVSSSAVLRLNFCAKNPPQRQAANRYIKLSEKFIGKHGENLQFCRSLENLVVFLNY